MSIKKEIASHELSGKLRLVTPKISSDRPLRNLYLTEELFDEVYEEKEDSHEIEMFARLIADLEVFVTSDTIDPGYLWCLEPARDGVWEIRSTRQEPQIRVFGVFAAKNIFVGTHHTLRGDLAKKDSKQWKIEIRRAKGIWRRLFPAYTHQKTKEPNQLFTGALDEKYFK